MSKSGGTNLTYVGVIFNHLMGIISRAYCREDMSTMVDTMWAMIDPWISDEVRRLWRRKCVGNSYKDTMWKLRCCMIALYEMEALPQSYTKNPEDILVYYDYCNPKDDTSRDIGIKIAEGINFKLFMLRYQYLFSELMQEGADPYTIEYMIDVGYALCTPYLSWEEQENWKETEQMFVMSPWRKLIDKLRILIGILDREALLFERRVVDTTSQWEETTYGEDFILDLDDEFD